MDTIQGLTQEDRDEQLYDDNVEIQELIWLPALRNEGMYDTFWDEFEVSHEKIFEACGVELWYPPCPPEETCEEQLEDYFLEEIRRLNRRGFLMEISLPVPSGFDEDAVIYCGRGFYNLYWIYVEDMEAVSEAAHQVKEELVRTKRQEWLQGKK